MSGLTRGVWRCIGQLRESCVNRRSWLESAGRSGRYLDAWAEILKGPVEEMLGLLELDSEYMRAMRQARPFAGVLSAKERWEIYDAFAVGTYYSGGGHDRR